MNNEKNRTEDEKPDLKHDTMEFAINADGEEITDPASLEDEDGLVTGEELDMLEDEPELEAAAFNAVEADLLADEDNLPEEDWLDDIPGGNAGEEDAEDERP